MTNCVNCGAPLSGGKCEYCGTEYNDGRIRASFSETDYTGTVSICGIEYGVYLAEMSADVISFGSRHDITGQFYRGPSVLKHTFKLVEI